MSSSIKTTESYQMPKVSGPATVTRDSDPQAKYKVSLDVSGLVFSGAKVSLAADGEKTTYSPGVRTVAKTCRVAPQGFSSSASSSSSSSSVLAGDKSSLSSIGVKTAAKMGSVALKGLSSSSSTSSFAFPSTPIKYGAMVPGSPAIDLRGATIRDSRITFSVDGTITSSDSGKEPSALDSILPSAQTTEIQPPSGYRTPLPCIVSQGKEGPSLKQQGNDSSLNVKAKNNYQLIVNYCGNSFIIDMNVRGLYTLRGEGGTRVEVIFPNLSKKIYQSKV